ncbi:hypothetical protein N9A49_01785 [Salibacteraceae bacterium]|jgi:hypothetical protein|nr:hypothetical protein [Salibacteraceae bacterium]
MDNYKLVKKGIFEKLASFEERINSMSAEGWNAISMSSDNNSIIVLMERRR